MKKNDWIIAGVLLVLMFGWMKFYPALEKKYFPRPEPPAAVVPAPAAVVEPAAAAVVSAVKEEPVPAIPVIEKPSVPEQTLPLANEKMELTVSSYGGSVLSAVLKDYPAENKEDSAPLTLDFTSAPALRYEGMPMPAGTLVRSGDGLVYTAVLRGGKVFKRTFALDGEYVLTIEDSFVNSSDTPWAMPALRLYTGPMANPAGTSAMRGITSLGVDSFVAGSDVEHQGKNFNKFFKEMPAGTMELTSTLAMVPPVPVDWVAAKNKFFVQILTPEGGADSFDLFVRREGEGKKMTMSEVSASMAFDSQLVAEGAAFTRTTRAYIGPKDFATLKTQGMDQTEVMEFRSTGMFKFVNPIMYPIKRVMLWGLVHLALFGNYGIAILLLTVIVRVIFWPLTHKGTESMKRMQALQPQMAALKEKYKDNPQRMQQETMALYKENKVNPMGGCLPMLIQIPVFIALFRVVRSAIELRFSKFLWINDLSEPENLFAGKFTIPFIGWDALNILPILMAVTMMWQQRLTSPAGTGTAEQQQQQKMMMYMMPIMMLFFFYSMPSGLVLYWTTSQCIMIAQMLIKKKKEA